MLRLHFLRHGRTEHSVRDVFCGGDCSVALDEAGVRMAQAAADSLGQLDWAAIVTSTQTRAVQTATPIAKAAGVELREDPRWHEIEYGEWDGRSEAELGASESDSGRLKAFRFDPSVHGPPQGETAADVALRVGVAIDVITEQHRTGEVLIVAHKTAIRVALCLLLGVPVKEYKRRFSAPLCGRTVVVLGDGDPRVETEASLEHLPEDLRAIAAG